MYLLTQYKVILADVHFLGLETRQHFLYIIRPVSRGGGGGGAFGLVPPRHRAKNISLSHILHKIKKKCISLAQLLLPDVNNQPFGHDSCCYLNHLLWYSSANGSLYGRQL